MLNKKIVTKSVCFIMSIAISVITFPVSSACAKSDTSIINLSVNESNSVESSSKKGEILNKLGIPTEVAVESDGTMKINVKKGERNEVSLLSGVIWTDGSWQNTLPQDRVRVAQQLAPIADYFNQSKWAKWALLSLNQETSKCLPSVLGMRYGTSFINEEWNRKAYESLNGKFTKGASIKDIVNDPVIVAQINEAVLRAFPYTNPVTGKKDIIGNEWYARYVGLGVATGVIGGKSIDGKLYFDGDAPVTRAEFMKMLVFCMYGSSFTNSDSYKRLDHASKDGVVSGDAWYRQSYNFIAGEYKSLPLYGAYNADELSKPITRAEMAYIVATRAQDGTLKWGASGIDWSKPDMYKTKFADMNISVDIQWTKSLSGEEGSNEAKYIDIPQEAIRPYLSGKTLGALVQDVKNNKARMPLPLFSAIFELNSRGIMNGAADGNMYPMKTLTRAEALMILVNLSDKCGYYEGDTYDNDLK